MYDTVRPPSSARQGAAPAQVRPAYARGTATTTGGRACVLAGDQPVQAVTPRQRSAVLSGGSTPHRGSPKASPHPPRCLPACHTSPPCCTTTPPEASPALPRPVGRAVAAAAVYPARLARAGGSGVGTAPAASTPSPCSRTRASGLSLHHGATAPPCCRAICKQQHSEAGLQGRWGSLLPKGPPPPLLPPPALLRPHSPATCEQPSPSLWASLQPGAFAPKGPRRAYIGQRKAISLWATNPSGQTRPKGLVAPKGPQGLSES